MRREVQHVESGFHLILIVHVLVDTASEAGERAGRLEVLHELVDVLVRARDDLHRQDILSLLDSRSNRGDPHIVGQRRLEPIEQVGPREGPPVDQLVGLTRLHRREFDLLWIDGGAQPCRLLTKIGGVRLVARRLRGELGVAS